MTIDQRTLAFLPNLGPLEITIIALGMLLLFGRRLPEVGRSLGQGIVQFKRGLKDVEDEVKQASSEPKKFDAAKTPTSGGEDQRVSQDAPPQATTSMPSQEPEKVQAEPQNPPSA